MDKPRVSIVITAYNSGKFIKRSIESVLNQTYQNIECIIVDDGSTDNTRDIILEYLKKDDRVKYYYKENGGEASAKNFGIEKTRSDWLHTLDADDWISDNKIERQLDAALRFKDRFEYILVYSDYEIVYVNEKEEVYKNYKVINGELSKEQILKKIISRKFGLDTPTPITMNSMLLSRNIFYKYSFNESMPNISDLELYYRMLQENIKCIYVPIISMYYRQHEQGISKDGKRQLKGYISFLETMYKTNKADLALFPNLNKMIQSAVRYKDTSTLLRIEKLLKKSKIPVYASIRGKELNIRNIAVMLSEIKLLNLATRMLLLSRNVKRRLM